MELTYNQLEHVIAAMLDVDDQHRPALRAKFKHLRSLAFPTGVNVGGSGRVVYNLERTAQVTLAFALMDAFVQPATAIALLATHWRDIRKAVAALLAIESTPLSVEPAARIADLMLVEPRGKRHWSAAGVAPGGPAGPGGPQLPMLRLVARDDIGDLLMPDPITGITATATIVDVSGWMSRLSRLCVLAGWATPERIRDQATKMLDIGAG